MTSPARKAAYALIAVSLLSAVASIVSAVWLLSLGDADLLATLALGENVPAFLTPDRLRLAAKIATGLMLVEAGLCVWLGVLCMRQSRWALKLARVITAARLLIAVMASFMTILQLILGRSDASTLPTLGLAIVATPLLLLTLLWLHAALRGLDERRP